MRILSCCTRTLDSPVLARLLAVVSEQSVATLCAESPRCAMMCVVFVILCFSVTCTGT